jgi:hypothetical protein
MVQISASLYFKVIHIPQVKQLNYIKVLTLYAPNVTEIALALIFISFKSNNFYSFGSYPQQCIYISTFTYNNNRMGN